MRRLRIAYAFVMSGWISLVMLPIMLIWHACEGIAEGFRGWKYVSQHNYQSAMKRATQ